MRSREKALKSSPLPAFSLGGKGKQTMALGRAVRVGRLQQALPRRQACPCGVKMETTNKGKPACVVKPGGKDQRLRLDRRLLSVCPCHPEPLLLAAILLLFLLPAAASAHHFLGIPHYKYGDDYPQIPYMEVLAQVGPHDLVFTHFPGFPKPGESVRFKLYVLNRETGEVFRDNLRVEVFRKHFLSGDEPVTKGFDIATGTGPEKNDYKFFVTFREAEAYSVQVLFPNQDGVERIPFPVTIGETDDRPLVFGAAGILGLAVLSVAFVKRRRQRVLRRREVTA